MIPRDGCSRVGAGIVVLGSEPLDDIGVGYLDQSGNVRLAVNRLGIFVHTGCQEKTPSPSSGRERRPRSSLRPEVLFSQTERMGAEMGHRPDTSRRVPRRVTQELPEAASNARAMSAMSPSSSQPHH